MFLFRAGCAGHGSIALPLHTTEGINGESSHVCVGGSLSYKVTIGDAMYRGQRVCGGMYSDCGSVLNGVGVGGDW